MATQSTLLCLILDSQYKANEIERNLCSWVLDFASNLARAAWQLKKNKYEVGLLFFDDDANQVVEIDQFLLKHNHLQWIAVLRKADLEKAEYRNIVLKHMCDYHTLPLDYERLKFTVGHAHGLARLQPIKFRPTIYGDSRKPVLIGSSKVILNMRTEIAKVSRASAPVLLTGETGTGKEIIAKTIHWTSSRAGFPLVPINCASLTPNLVNAQLFGFERGAFTGAQESKPGLLEAANRGTVLLDEIADIPFNTQATFLRFLQEKTVRRLGSRKDIRVDVRIIAATHVDLENAVLTKQFREDLYYRLAVLPINVPPLRERAEDIKPLSEYFYRLFEHEKASQVVGYSNATIEAMMRYSWPGNVRELVNRVRRGLALAEGKLIRAIDLGSPFSAENTRR